MRRALRFVLILLATVASLVTLVLAWIVTFGHQRSRRRIQHATFRLWSHFVLWCLGAQVRVEGEPPEDGALLVCNHLSYIDIPLIAHVLPPRFVAKAEIRSWPLIGWCCRGVETIFVDRSSKRDTVRVAELMREGLRRGDNVVLFPEGTSGPGHGLLPFRPPLLAPAAESGLPVHYAALHYETAPPDPPAFLSLSWWGDMPFGPHAAQLLRMHGFCATIRFGEDPVIATDRKELASELERRIGEILTPTVDFEPESPERPFPRDEADPTTREPADRVPDRQSVPGARS